MVLQSAISHASSPVPTSPHRQSGGLHTQTRCPQRSFRERTFNSLISLVGVSCKTENHSLCLFLLLPTHRRTNREGEIVNTLMCFKITTEEVEGSGNLLKSVSQASEVPNPIDLGWKPKNLLFLFYF